MMIFFSDEYADLFNHSRNKQYSSSAALSDNDLEDMIANPYGYTPGEDSVRTDAQLTTGQTPLDIQSTGTLFSSYGEKSVQEILGNAMNSNASIAASSSQSLQQMTDYAASFTSSGRGTGGDSDDAGAAVVEGDVFGISTPTAPASIDGKSLSEIRLARQARKDGMKPSSRAKRTLNMGAKNYTFDARSNKDFE